MTSLEMWRLYSHAFDLGKVGRCSFIDDHAGSGETGSGIFHSPYGYYLREACLFCYSDLQV